METLSFISTANRACSLLYSFIKNAPFGRWILPVNVCPDVPLTFCLAEVPFTFVDIDPDTLCLDMKKVIRRIDKEPYGYAGVLYVRTYGVLKDISRDFIRIKSISSNIKIIDDRCLCIPERQPKFGDADMILYSTGHCKQIDFNGGGLAYTKSSELILGHDLYYDGTDESIIYKEAYKRGEPIRIIPKGWLKIESYLSPSEYLDKIERAAILRKEIRRKINSIYAENLPSNIQMNEEFQTWRFNIKVSAKIKRIVIEELFNQGLFASSHYHSVSRLFNTQKFPVSDSLFENVINLFNDNYYNQEKAYKTCKIIVDIMKKNNFDIS